MTLWALYLTYQGKTVELARYETQLEALTAKSQGERRIAGSNTGGKYFVAPVLALEKK